MLAVDLNDLIAKYGAAMADAAESVLTPLFDPTKDALPDLSELEACRTRAVGKQFNFFNSQKLKIAGCLASMKRDRVVWPIWEMGTGKSCCSLAMGWLKFKHKPFRAVVICPSHLVVKWKREIDWLIPNVECFIIKKFADLVNFHNRTRKSSNPMFAVISKETAKLGVDVDRPCAAMRSVQQLIKGTYANGFLDRRVVVHVAACPTCGTVVKTSDGSLLPIEDYIQSNTSVTCDSCGDKLLTNARGFRKNPHIDRYIQRKMKGVFDLLIADEVHELAGVETIQGNMFGTIASAVRLVIDLTGTLIGGKASDLHASLWRMSPRLLKDRGFTLCKGDGKISPIARAERGFARRYGVMEKQEVRDIGQSASRVHRGRCGRKKTYKTEERIRPGISPDLFNHFMIGNSVFMSLSELELELPTLERVIVPCKMSPALECAYKQLDSELTTAIKEKRCKGKGPPVLATIKVMALDAYLDRPWGWEPIVVPVYDDSGDKNGTEAVAWPQDLGENHVDGKDRELVKICKAEHEQGRRCCVYIQYTDVHDCRAKIQKVLEKAGLRAVQLPDNVKPIDREGWIEKHAKDIDVLIVHPKRVMTGLDLIQFPSLVWHQVGYSTHVLRQGSARARRPTQSLPCKVFYMYYEETQQEKALAYMGEKEAASMALEGTFDAGALQTLMNGSDGDDVLTTLAANLDKRTDTVAIWKKLDGKTVVNTVKNIVVLPIGLFKQTQFFDVVRENVLVNKQKTLFA